MATPLNDCGCCEGITALVPEPLSNRPGLSQVSYRIGTHGDFLASALAALSDPQFPALRSLTTREQRRFHDRAPRWLGHPGRRPHFLPGADRE